jgi:hypothetical protein
MRPLFFVVATALACGGAFVACTEDAPHDQPASVVDSGADSGAAVDASDANTGDSSDSAPECFINPKTHYEIINACTDAARVDKHPTGLPFLPDGALPPPP